MPMPSFRPSNVINAVKRGSADGHTVWVQAHADPVKHYQRLAVLFGYVHATPEGYVLTDLGVREMAE